MTIWDLCIKRPIFTAMLVSAPIVLGLMARARLGVNLLPNVEVPVVVVSTTLRGAGVEEMETSVTKPLEEIINTVNGIDEIHSTTKEGISQIVVQFVLEKSRDVAAQEVRDKISTVLSTLPIGTDQPVIDKIDLSAMPVLSIAVSSDRPMQEITEIARKKIKEDLESLSGVGAVILVGGRQRAVNVIVDTDKLTAYNLSIDDVRQALIQQNLEMPGGRVDRGARELVLRTMGRVRRTADFRDLIVANQNGYPVRIRDLGRVEDTFEEPRGLARLSEIREADGERRVVSKNAVSLIVQKQSGDNTVTVVERVKRRLDEIRQVLPPDIETFVVKDQSIFIVRSIEELNFHLVVAALLVAATILVFIQDWRTTIIAGLSIPASIIATFAFMYWMGYTLNNMTMLGLILAIGIVIDDAVVIHENIFRHMEENRLPAMKAAAAATREIALAVSATTLSLLVIFLPIVFMSGLIGRFFSSFGATVAFSILMSWFVSFTMTPMLCSRFLKLDKKGGSGSKSNFVWRTVDGFYARLLGWSLRRRWAIVLSCVVFFAMTPLFFKLAGFDFIPRDDQSEFEVAVTLPEGYTLEEADRAFAGMEARVAGLPCVSRVFSTIGDTTGRIARGQGDVTMGTIYARMTDLQTRQRKWYDPKYLLHAILNRPEDDPRYFTQFDVQRKAHREMASYPDFRIAVQDAAVVSGSGMKQSLIEFSLRGPDLKKLEAFTGNGDYIDPRTGESRPGLVKWMKGEPWFLDVNTSLSLRKPELRVLINREKASDLGIPVRDIASNLNVLVGGEPVTKYKELDEQYDVWLRADLRGRDRPAAVTQLMIPSPRAGLVQLSSLATLNPEKGPATIERFGMQHQVGVTANLRDGVALGNAAQRLADHVREMGLPINYRSEFLGKIKMLNQSNDSFLIAFLASFLFMYMILAAQFESFVHPITILLALPLTLPFALISLILLRTNLDIYAMFGLFMLFGIVKKNGILQVDYTNVLRNKGIAERSDPGGQPHAVAADSDDHGDADRGDGPHRAGPRSRRRFAREPGQSGPRRPDALAAPDSLAHSRGVLPLGRPFPILVAALGPFPPFGSGQRRSGRRKHSTRRPSRAVGRGPGGRTDQR